MRNVFFPWMDQSLVTTTSRRLLSVTSCRVQGLHIFRLLNMIYMLVVEKNKTCSTIIKK